MRHGDDREAGRLRRARQHHARADAAAATASTAHRPQVVLLGADVRRCSSCSRRPPSGLTCFLAAARAARRHAQRASSIQRLKDKLGNRSNASSEVEFDGAWARLVGEEGRGVPTIIEMVNHTRLDCVIGVGGRDARRRSRRRPATPRHRSAFGKLLVDQPLMRNVLADLARRVRGRDGARAAPRARLRRGAATERRRLRAPGHARWPSTGSASARPATPPRRWSAWAATATSRSRRCRACTARRR